MPLRLFKNFHLNQFKTSLCKIYTFGIRNYNRQKNNLLYTLILTTIINCFIIAAPYSLLAQNKNSKPPSMQVGIDPVINQPIKQTIPVIGRFVVRQAGVVSAIINGPVGEFKIEIGDRINAGEIIAVLMSESLKWRNELQKAENEKKKAALQKVKARLRLRRQELKRLEGLQKSAAFSKARLDDKRQEVIVAESEADEALADLAIAKANRKLADINLYNANIRAPYSGVITKRFTEVGSYVKVGDPIVAMIDDLHLEIEAEIPTNRISGLKPTLKVKALANSNINFFATVRAVVPNENPKTRTRSVRFIPKLPAKFKNIANNQSVTIYIPSNSQANAVTVHKDAVISRKGMSLVYIAKNGKAEIRTVQIGDAVGSRFIVNSGLTLGDLAIVRGNERLRPGQQISYSFSE